MSLEKVKDVDEKSVRQWMTFNQELALPATDDALPLLVDNADALSVPSPMMLMV